MTRKEHRRVEEHYYISFEFPLIDVPLLCTRRTDNGVLKAISLSGIDCVHAIRIIRFIFSSFFRKRRLAIVKTVITDTIILCLLLLLTDNDDMRLQHDLCGYKFTNAAVYYSVYIFPGGGGNSVAGESSEFTDFLCTAARRNDIGFLERASHYTSEHVAQLFLTEIPLNNDSKSKRKKKRRERQQTNGRKILQK